MSASDTLRVLVVGASRGIGLEFVRHYRRQGGSVLATVRDAASAESLRALGVEVWLADLLDAASLSALADRLSRERLSLAILNAGVTGARAADLRQPPTREQFDQVMHVNVHAPLSLAAPLIDALGAQRGTLACLTSRMGSIAGVAAPGSALYRVSKAAENMVARLAHLQGVATGVRVLALHPGWVRTDMGGANADIDVATSVAGMAAVIANPSAYPSGTFVDYRGVSIDW